jgi:hypothetical protein
MDLDIGGILAEVGGALSAQAAGGAEGLNNFLAAQSQRRQQASAQAFQRESQTRDQLFRQEQSELDRQFRAEEAAKERSFRGTQAALDRKTLKTEKAEEAAAALTLSVAGDTRLEEQLRSRVGAAPDAPFAEVASSLVGKVGSDNVGVVLGAAREAIQGEDRTAEFVGVTSAEFGAVSPEERLRISQQVQLTQNKLTGWEAHAADLDARRTELLTQEGLAPDRRLELLNQLDAEYLSLSTAWKKYKEGPELLEFRPGSKLSVLETKVGNQVNRLGADFALGKESLETTLASGEVWGSAGIAVADSRVFDPDVSPKVREVILSTGNKAAHFDAVVDQLRNIESDTLFKLGLDPQTALQLGQMKDFVDAVADEGGEPDLLQVGNLFYERLNEKGLDNPETKRLGQVLDSVFNLNPETIADRVLVYETDQVALAEADAVLNSTLSPFGISLEDLPYSDDELLAFASSEPRQGGGPSTRSWNESSTARFMRQPDVVSEVVTKLVGSIPPDYDKEDRDQAIRESIDALQLESADKAAYLQEARSRSEGFGLLSPDMYRPISDIARAEQVANRGEAFDVEGYVEAWKRGALFTPDQRRSALEVFGEYRGTPVSQSAPLTYEDLVGFFGLRPESRLTTKYLSTIPVPPLGGGFPLMSRDIQLRDLSRRTEQEISAMPPERLEGAKLLVGLLRNMTEAEREEAFYSPDSKGITFEQAGFTPVPSVAAAPLTGTALIDQQIANVRDEIARMDDMTGRSLIAPGLFTEDSYLTTTELQVEKEALLQTAERLERRKQAQAQLGASLPTVVHSPRLLIRAGLDYKDPRTAIAAALTSDPIEATDLTDPENERAKSPPAQKLQNAVDQFSAAEGGGAADQLLMLLDENAYARQSTLLAALREDGELSAEFRQRNREIIAKTEALAELLEREERIEERLLSGVRSYLNMDKWTRMSEETADDRFFKAFYLLAATETASSR